MVRLSEFERHKKAADLLLDLRESYRMLEVFAAMLQDRGDKELAERIFHVINTVDECCSFINDFVKNCNAPENAIINLLNKMNRRNI